MAEIFDLSPIDDANQGRWTEGVQTINNVNNAGRADEGILGRWYGDVFPGLLTGGTGNDYTATTLETVTALFDGFPLRVLFDRANTGNVTLNVNALGATPVRYSDNSELASGAVQPNTHVDLIFRGNVWYVEGTVFPTPPAVIHPYDVAFYAGYDEISSPISLLAVKYRILTAPRDFTIIGDVGTIETPSVGAAVTADIKVAGVTVYDTVPSWAATTGTYTAGVITGGTFDVTEGQNIDFEVLTVGTTTAGAGLRFSLKGQS